MTTAFLVLSLLFPRCTLAICWLCGWMPANDTPLAADVVSFFLAPRLLVAWWTHTGDAHPIWTVLYVGCFVLAALGGGSGGTKVVYRDRPARRGGR